MMKNLNHPNIIQFKDVFKDKKSCMCLVMENLDGDNL